MADAKIINYGQQISAGSTAIPDNTSEALDIESTDGGEYITINTTDGGEQLILGVGPTRPNVMKIKADDGSVSNTTNVGWYLDRADPSATNPVFVPKGNDPDTGIGHAADDQLSLIAGGVERARLYNKGVTITGYGGTTGASPNEAEDVALYIENSTANSTNACVVELNTDGSSGSQIWLSEADTLKNTIGSISGHLYISTKSADGDLILRGNSVERMRIDAETGTTKITGPGGTTGDAVPTGGGAPSLYIESGTGASSNRCSIMMNADGGSGSQIDMYVENDRKLLIMATASEQTIMAEDNLVLKTEATESARMTVGTSLIQAHAPLETIGALGTALTGTFTATNGSAEITSGSSTAFTTELHVGSAIELFESSTSRGVFTVTAIASDTALTLDSTVSGLSSSPKTGITGKTDSGELFAVKTGDSKSILAVNGSGVIQIPNGTKAAPSLHFAAATDTGFYSPAAGQLAATCDASDAQGGRVLHLEGTEDTPGGKNNLAVGPDSLKLLLDLADQTARGSYNVGLGGFSCNKITTGHGNLGIGRGSLWNAGTSSAYNVGIGLNTLLGTGVKSNNTAIGTQAGSAVTTGGTNTMVGYQAADSVTTTGTGTYIGASTAASAATGVSNETCLGYAAVGQGSNTIMLGDSNVTGLHCYDTSISSPSDFRIKDNVQNSVLGLDFINALRPVKYQKKHASEFPEEIREERWFERTKTNISDSGEVTEYTIPADEKPADWQPKTEYGLIAQEVKAAMDSHGGADWQGHTVLPSGMESLGYGNLVTVLVKAVQELTSQNESLAARIATLEAGD